MIVISRGKFILFFLFVFASANLFAQTEQTSRSESPTTVLTNCNGDLNDINKKIDSINKDYKQIAQDMNAGLYCSKCMRSKTELDKTEKGGFYQHLEKVDAIAEPATQEMMDQKYSDYKERYNDLDSQFEQKSRGCVDDYKQAVINALQSIVDKQQAEIAKWQQQQISKSQTNYKIKQQVSPNQIIPSNVASNANTPIINKPTGTCADYTFTTTDGKVTLTYVLNLIESKTCYYSDLQGGFIGFNAYYYQATIQLTNNSANPVGVRGYINSSSAAFDNEHILGPSSCSFENMWDKISLKFDGCNVFSNCGSMYMLPGVSFTYTGNFWTEIANECPVVVLSDGDPTPAGAYLSLNYKFKNPLNAVNKINSNGPKLKPKPNLVKDTVKNNTNNLLTAQQKRQQRVQQQLQQQGKVQAVQKKQEPQLTDAQRRREERVRQQMAKTNGHPQVQSKIIQNTNNPNKNEGYTGKWTYAYYWGYNIPKTQYWSNVFEANMSPEQLKAWVTNQFKKIIPADVVGVHIQIKEEGGYFNAKEEAENDRNKLLETLKGNGEGFNYISVDFPLVPN